MFDPFHNAKKAGKYYLVKGDGPWFGSWQNRYGDLEAFAAEVTKQGPQ